MKYLFVVNPVAGGRDKTDFLASLEEKSQESGFSYKVFETKGEGEDEATLRRYISESSPERVAAVGGDGTVQLVGKVLREKDIPMGIIPFGSANGLATELEIPKNSVKSLELFLNGEHTRLLDIIEINEKYCCLHFADIGMNADLIRNFESDRERGIFTYAKYFLKRLEQRQLEQFEIQLDDQTMTYSGYMLALANARRLGTGVVLNRCGKIGDGLFEIVIIQEVRLADLIKAGWSVLDPDVEYGEAITCLSCRDALIQLSSPRHLQVDGELVGKVDKVRARIVPEVIQAVIPGHSR